MDTIAWENLFKKGKANLALTLEVLDLVNQGKVAQGDVSFRELPPVDGKEIVDLRQVHGIEIPELHWHAILENHTLKINPEAWGALRPPDTRWFSESDLQKLGLYLAGYSAYGVLNGGSATSYADKKKNQGFSEKLFEIFAEDFQNLQTLFMGKPKGITPGFFQKNGTPGPSFMELKFRNLLIHALARKVLFPDERFPDPGIFQMTSDDTDGPLALAYESYWDSDLLHDLLKELGLKKLQIDTRIQPLIGAFTPGNQTGPRDIFTIQRQGQTEILPLPGGHGQNFRVLRPIYEKFNAQGFWSASIGNVDNLGYLPSFRTLALVFLQGNDAAFDFSFRTKMDVKGGILYRDTEGRLNCADLGVAIKNDVVQKEESQGAAVLFNCASGVFSLNSLTKNIQYIIDNLPLRVSEQDKDIGKYSQAEQVTWEVLGLLKKPMIAAVDKKRRFLAAKLLMENFITSGLHFNPNSHGPWSEFVELAQELNQGLKGLLEGPYGMKEVDGVWLPLSVQELKDRILKEGLGFLSF